MFQRGWECNPARYTGCKVVIENCIETEIFVLSTVSYSISSKILIILFHRAYNIENMVWLCWAYITPTTPGIEAGPWASKGSSFPPKQASKGSRCGHKFAGCRGLEAQVPSNHPMSLPPSSLDYRTEPPVPAKATSPLNYHYLIISTIIFDSYCPFDPQIQKMKSRIPHLFGLKLRYGMGIFPYEIVLRDIPFKKSCGPKTTI
jgi:hypothetical protein